MVLQILTEGEYVSLDGNTGGVFVGRVKLETEYPEKLLSEVQQWKIIRN
jgi:phosphoenolpyruvate synthase/pyruvate phosphate dikinase